MRMTRRSFLKSILVGGAAATVPLTVGARVNTGLPPDYARTLDAGWIGAGGRQSGKSSMLAMQVLSQVSQGRDAVLYTTRPDFNIGLCRALAKSKFGMDMAWLTNTENADGNPVRVFIFGRPGDGFPYWESLIEFGQLKVVGPCLN